MCAHISQFLLCSPTSWPLSSRFNIPITIYKGILKSKQQIYSENYHFEAFCACIALTQHTYCSHFKFFACLIRQLQFCIPHLCTLDRLDSARNFWRPFFHAKLEIMNYYHAIICNVSKSWPFAKYLKFVYFLALDLLVLHSPVSGIHQRKVYSHFAIQLNC